MAKSGLKKVVKSVHGKHGTVRRSYWVSTKEAVKRVARNHGGKIVGAALLVGGAALAHKHRDKLNEFRGTHLNKKALGVHFSGAVKSANHWRMTEGANLAKRVVQGVGTALATHYISKAAGAAGERVGKRIGGKRGKEFGRVAGEAIGEHTLGHSAEGLISRAAVETGKALRRKNIVRAPKRR